MCSNVSTKPGKRALDLVEPFVEQYTRRQRIKNALPPRLFTVGRLDVNSSGLLLITNDGEHVAPTRPSWWPACRSLFQACARV